MKFDQYPVYLDEDEFVQFWKEYFEDHQMKENEDVNIYVHFPWCRSVCKFCIFGALKLDDAKNIVAPYEKATLRMMEKMAPIIEKQKVSELFFGGGTPSLWSMESLNRMTEIIPNYNDIGIRRTEIHPIDMTEERMDFMINTMKFHHISIGVQSFNKEACKDQGRIHITPEKLAHIVHTFQKAGLYVNCDLVAMFNGQDPKNWDIFKEDIELMANIVHPDAMTVSPNYREDYYNISYKFRQIIKEFNDKHSDYHLNYGDIGFSLDKMDIIRYMDKPYIFVTENYSQFVIDHPVLSETKTKEQMDNRNMIAFGGITGECAFSRTAEYHYISGLYIPSDDEFRYTCSKHGMFERLSINNDDAYYNNQIKIGQGFILPPPVKE